MTRPWSVNVEQDVVHVNAIDVLAESDRCIVLEADLRAKHAIAGAVWDDDDGTFGLMIDADSDTLHVEPAVGWTKIVFRGLPGWRVACAEVSKYTLTVTLLRGDRSEREEIWRDE